MKTITCALLAVALSMPMVAGADDGDLASIALRYNPDSMPLTDVVGDRALHAYLDVTNHVGAAVVLISIRAPEGAQFAQVQEPALGWATKATRSTVEFVGVLDAAQRVELPLRIVDSASARSGEFTIFVHTTEADLTMSVSEPLTALEQDAGAYVCQLVFMSAVGDALSFAPVSTLSGKVASSGTLLVAVYDPEYGAYVDTDRVDADVTVRSLAGGLLAVPADALVDAPFVDTPAGPVLSLPGSAAQVRAAQLWGAADAGRAWFERHPGAFVMQASASIDGNEVCASQPYSFAASLTPEAPGVALPTPLVLVPPELDSDADGFANVAELRANSQPLVHASTPYTDDDLDDIENGRDAFTVPSALVG